MVVERREQSAVVLLQGGEVSIRHRDQLLTGQPPLGRHELRQNRLVPQRFRGCERLGRLAYHDGLRLGDPVVNDLQSQREHGSVAILLDRSIESGLPRLGIRKGELVVALLVDGVPQALTEGKRNIVFRELRMRNPRQTRRIALQQCGHVLIGESVQAGAIALDRGRRIRLMHGGRVGRRFRDPGRRSRVRYVLEYSLYLANSAVSDFEQLEDDE